jgi:phosphatidylserine/phosphatidylglycerophosphate/cardiolipin synthase-like enzyme
VSRAFARLSCADLRVLAGAASAGRLGRPFWGVAIGRLLGPSAARETVDELERLGLESASLAAVLSLIAAEREAAEATAGRVELVWTGPETPGSASRDTAVVVRELFSTAETLVLASGFAVHQGRDVFEPLARRMADRPGVKVKLFLNVPRPQGSRELEHEIVRDFVEAFRAQQWPGPTLPEIYYDPRSLVEGYGDRAVLHAKCIVTDDRRAFLTSANLTEAAQQRNIEAGVVIEDAALARNLRRQFETLVEAGVLRAACRP